MDDKKWRGVLDIFEETVLKGREVVYVAGYPRSGTTWLTRLLAQCLNSPSLSWSVRNDVREPRFRDPAVEGLHRRGPYAVRHGHWKARERKGDKVVVLHRDPRDVAVSCFHYFPYRHDGRGGMENCVAEMCGQKGKVLNFVNVNGRGWAGYVGEWLRAGAVRARYEDLLEETEATITGIIEELGLPRQPARRVRRAVEDHAFANRVKDKTMRRGVVGAWRTELPPELAQKLAFHSAREMKALGYASGVRPANRRETPRPPPPEPRAQPPPPARPAHVLDGRGAKRGR